ncbi:ABC-2 family transporter protein [Candidatus Microgenomates bacterium]|nr:ABC-2 family transporter protein [Candidatus Microgenomates bacterium]
MKYLKFYLLAFKMALMEQMGFRANFLMWAFVHSLSLLSYFFFFKIVFSQVAQINGWGFNQTLLVLGTGELITGIGSLTFFPFMYDFSRDIARGTFDFKLTKPIDPHFHVAFRYPDIEDMTTIPIAILLIWYAVSNMQIQNLGLNLVGFFILVTSSLIILFSLLTLFESLAFKYVRVEKARDLFWSIANLTRYPAKSIHNSSIIITVFLLPVALISSVPAEVLFGKLDWPWILGSISLAASSLIVSRSIFQKSLRFYTSASS